ncbi:hypothetical protein IKR55_04415 [bacterium]|nr:hypothetical protein [bacterium]
MQVNSIQNISFGSTYRIPLVEQGVTPAKRVALKKLVSKYQNYRYPNGNNGCVRLSIRKRLDPGFEQKLRQLGFKVYQKFEKHNIPKTDNRMDKYISTTLKNGEYHQFGKQKRG